MDLDAFVVMPDHLQGIIIINRYAKAPSAVAVHATALARVSVFSGEYFVKGNGSDILPTNLTNRRELSF
jgi:hypothetical protein